MKRIASFGAALLVSCAMAFSMTACTPTANNPLQQEAQSQAEAERQTNPDGEIYETVDGAEEKLNMVVTDEPSIMVSVYTINENGTGLNGTGTNGTGTTEDELERWIEERMQQRQNSTGAYTTGNGASYSTDGEATTLSAEGWAA